MFYCMDCGTILEEEKLCDYKEMGEFWGSEYTVTSKVCPKCKSSAVLEITKRCDFCGEYIIGEYIAAADGRSYCENCYMKGDTINEYDC